MIDFEKPKKVRTTAEHNSIFMSDSGVNGTYVSNMSQTDMEKWKGKHITGDNERIEIRKTLHGTQLLIIVRKHPPMKQPKVYDHDLYKKYSEQQSNIKMSMNGSLWMSFDEQKEMQEAIDEAKSILGI